MKITMKLLESLGACSTSTLFFENISSAAHKSQMTVLQIWKSLKLSTVYNQKNEEWIFWLFCHVASDECWNNLLRLCLEKIRKMVQIHVKEKSKRSLLLGYIIMRIHEIPYRDIPGAFLPPIPEVPELDFRLYVTIRFANDVNLSSTIFRTMLLLRYFRMHDDADEIVMTAVRMIGKLPEYKAKDE